MIILGLGTRAPPGQQGHAAGLCRMAGRRFVAAWALIYSLHVLGPAAGPGTSPAGGSRAALDAARASSAMASRIIHQQEPGQT